MGEDLSQEKQPPFRPLLFVTNVYCLIYFWFEVDDRIDDGRLAAVSEPDS
jgi:hypothetical protein